MRTAWRVLVRHGASRPSNVNADLRVRNTWVTSVDVTMKTRARKAVLLHLGGGSENQIRECWILTKAYLFQGENSLLTNAERRLNRHGPLG